MSWNPMLDPDCPLDEAVDSIEAFIVPRACDMGGLEVRRALPEAAEDDPSTVAHAPKDALPFLEGEVKTVRLILGTAYEEASPVKAGSKIFYADAVLRPDADIPLPDDHEDRSDAVKEAWRVGDLADGWFRLPSGDDADFISMPERQP